VWFGTISFGLYLWHYMILRAIKQAAFFSTLHGIALGLAGLGASVAVAASSYYLVEYRAIPLARSCWSFREVWPRMCAREACNLAGLLCG
jgi:peptidoglycan/LPS O-acetylase OafA/YrhL